MLSGYSTFAHGTASKLDPGPGFNLKFKDRTANMRTIYWKKERLQHTRYVNRACVALVLQGPLCKTALKCIKKKNPPVDCRQGQAPASDLKCLFLFKLYKRTHSISLHCGHDSTESPWATFSFSDQSEHSRLFKAATKAKRVSLTFFGCGNTPLDGRVLRCCSALQRAC